MANIGNKIYGWYKSNPSYNVPNKLYTTSADIYLNMILYDSAGNDTNFRINQINQDGSFDIGSYNTVYCYKDNNLNQYYIFNSTPVIGDNVYNEDGNFEGNIINIDGNNISITSQITRIKNAGLVSDSFSDSYNAGNITDSTTSIKNAGTFSGLTASYYSAGNNEALLLLSNNSIILKKYNFTINPNPIDSTVIFNGIIPGTVSGNSLLNVLPGKNISYSVSKPEYLPITDTYIMIAQNHIEDINLNYGIFTLTINPTPSDATVVLTADGYTQVGNSISVYYGTNVSYSISKEHYITYSNTKIVNSDETISVNLTKNNYTLTINPTPSDATVTLTASGYTQVGNSITVPYETEVTYTVSKTDYHIESNTITVIENNTLDISIDHIGSTDYAIAIDSEDNTAILMKYVGTDTDVIVPEWVE